MKRNSKTRHGVQKGKSRGAGASKKKVCGEGKSGMTKNGQLRTVGEYRKVWSLWAGHWGADAGGKIFAPNFRAQRT